MKKIPALILALLAPIASAQVVVNPGGGSSSSTPTATSISIATTCVDAGASDTYACDLPATPTYSNGFWAAFQANTANIGAATINFNSVGALTIKRKTTAITSDLVTGDIRADQWVIGFYDGTNFQCVSCDGSATYYNSAVSWASTQTMAVNQVIGFGNSATTGAIEGNSLQTPDTVALETGSLSNCFNVFEAGDRGSDMGNGSAGTSASTDPCINIHSAVADQTQYNTLAAWGSAGGAVKTLTESSATALVRISVPTNSRASGEIIYEIYATDGTDMQVRSSRIRYAMTNKAGTEACTLVAADGAAANAETNDDNASSITAGTLTYGIACTNNAADTMDITFNAVSSLVQTTLQATWSVQHLSPGAPARQ